MAKKMNKLAAALGQVSGVDTTDSQIDSKNPQKKDIADTSSTPTKNEPPSRRGKKYVGGYFDPAVSKQLKQISIDRDATIQDLVGEAVNDLFVKYGRKPIA